MKDVSDRRALRYELSLGETQPLAIKIVRFRLDTSVKSFEQRMKEVRAELTAVRQSIAATHWALVESGSIASLPPSSSRSLSIESATPPAIQ